ncbi:FMN-dependent alpha-hydroxy acid dehydrogenase [Cadophora sp. DSE1049]|nr:FMN-dependent alpha-hydroxy acid dehydrogenase [Cadophora sp. DSE1049]
MAETNANEDSALVVAEALKSISASNFGAFQNEIYAAGMLHQQFPLVTTDPNKLEDQARKCLPPAAYNYVAGGAGERATMVANRLAFMQWKIVPRMLRPTGKRDLHVELFGEIYKSPILMAPVGVQSIFHSDKETGLAQVCAETGVPYILSTASTSTIEEVAAASTGPKWFQLYWPKDHSITNSLLNRAKSQGYKVLVVTLDTWTLAWRPADLDGGYIPFVKGLGNQIGFSDPVFRAKIASKYDGATPEERVLHASQEWLQDVFSGSSQGWEDLKLLREAWDGPIVLKGIQHPDDARLAVEAGCNGIIVSNHGGRQLDGAVGSLDMLPEIVEAVGNKVTVLFDSGIRTGADIIKALSLGAKAVLVARPVIYGLAIAGKKGAKQVLQGLLADLDQSMGLAGIKDIEGCNEAVLKKIPYGGHAITSN